MFARNAGNIQEPNRCHHRSTHIIILPATPRPKLLRSLLSHVEIMVPLQENGAFYFKPSKEWQKYTYDPPRLLEKKIIKVALKIDAAVNTQTDIKFCDV